MKKIMLLILVLFQNLAIGQDLEANIGLAGRYEDDAIQLRWAPDRASIWEIGLEQGYILERADYRGKNKRVETLDFEQLSEKPFTPWPQTEWNKYFNKNIEENREKQLMNIAYLFNIESRKEEEDVENPSSMFENGLSSMLEQKQQSDDWFGFSMVAADQSFKVAEAIGLGFIDENTERGQTYVYRIRLAVNSGIYSIEPTYLIISAKEKDLVDFEKNIQIEEQDQKILLNWEKQEGITAYSIFRSDDGNQTYKALNDAPLADVSPVGIELTSSAYLDELGLENYKAYYYRIYGHNVFGDSVLLGAVKAMPRDRTPPQRPIIQTPKHLSAEMVQVTWKMNEPLDEDLLGFQISRGDSISGPFTPVGELIEDRNRRFYNDTAYDQERPNFYIVEAIDTAGNRIRSNAAYVTLVDSVPPKQPIILLGEMDSSGIVKLVIRANKEKDLLGYRVLKSNASYHEYSVFYESFAFDNDTIALDTIIYDTSTLNTLTEAIYYKVAALDHHHNSSEFSEPLKVTRPDTIPPVSPVFKKYTVTPKSVNLEIALSASKDVRKQILLRRLENNTLWDTLTILGSEVNLYTDTMITQSKVYEYALIAVDGSDLESEQSRSIIARPYHLAGLPSVRNLKGRWDEENKEVIMSWEYESTDEEQYFFVIYKRVNDGVLESLDRVEASRLIYVDREVVQNKYSYQVKVFSTRGESPLSGELIIEVN